MSENSGRKAFVAGADLAAGRLVKITSASTVPPTVGYAGSNEQPIGSVDIAAVSGAVVSVRLINVAGSCELVASEAITAGSAIYTAANGKVTDTAPGSPVIRGQALETATADGDVIECLLF